LGEDQAWPRFGPRAADLGVHSAISLPLVLDGNVLGALNVYSHQHNAFDGSSRHIGEQFAAPAAVAIHNAQILDQSRRATARLEAALTGRSMIDRAVGIVMARSGVSADDAFLRLRIMSQQQNLSMVVVATRLVDEAVQQAQDRKPRQADRSG
jgi:GAF domain-containing protein